MSDFPNHWLLNNTTPVDKAKLEKFARAMKEKVIPDLVERKYQQQILVAESRHRIIRT